MLFGPLVLTNVRCGLSWAVDWMEPLLARGILQGMRTAGGPHTVDNVLYALWAVEQKAPFLKVICQVQRKLNACH